MVGICTRCTVHVRLQFRCALASGIADANTTIAEARLAQLNLEKVEEGDRAFRNRPDGGWPVAGGGQGALDYEDRYVVDSKGKVWMKCFHMHPGRKPPGPRKGLGGKHPYYEPPADPHNPQVWRMVRDLPPVLPLRGAREGVQVQLVDL